MAKLTAEILRLDPGCEGPACVMRDVQVIVDPLVFRQHGVTRVPALAMIPGDPVLPYCEREDESPRAAHVAYGDAALSGLPEEIARLGGKEEVRDAQSRLEGRYASGDRFEGTAEARSRCARQPGARPTPQPRQGLERRGPPPPP